MDKELVLSLKNVCSGYRTGGIFRKKSKKKAGAFPGFFVSFLYLRKTSITGTSVPG